MAYCQRDLVRVRFVLGVVRKSLCVRYVYSLYIGVYLSGLRTMYVLQIPGQCPEKAGI